MLKNLLPKKINISQATKDLLSSMTKMTQDTIFSRRNTSTTSSSNAVCALIIGAPGSGKGTISEWIVRDFQMKHISSGDLLRSEVQSGSPLGQELKSVLEAGRLVSDETVIDLFSKKLGSHSEENWLLDGFPRTLQQAKALQTVTPVNMVLHLDVPFQVIIDRVKDRLVHPGSGRIYNTLFNPPKEVGKDDVTGESLIQREDDKPDSVLKRLEIFAEKTQPVLDFYAEMGILKVFKGTESKVIYPDVDQFLKSKLKK